jgi:hypothetical protein
MKSEYEVLKIQSVWKGYKARKALRILKKKRDKNFSLSINPSYTRSILKTKNLYEILKELYIPDNYLANLMPRPTMIKYDYIDSMSEVVPDKIAINAIINFYKNNKINYILELGAGLGLWAALLNKGGLTVKATDKEGKTEPYTDIEELEATDAVEKYQDSDCLFICCPDSDSSYADDALYLFTGKYVIYIGEGDEGYNAEQQFFYQLEDDWTHIQTVNVKKWDRHNAQMDFYVRK